MVRYTKFDDDLQEYVFIKDIEPESLANIIGMLEDYKDRNEYKFFADYVISIRKKKGLSQEEFATLVHDTRSNIANYESRKSKYPKYLLRKIAKYTDTPIKEIKSVYKKFYYGLDDDEIEYTFSHSKNEKERNILAGRILQFEREFYEISKIDLAKALTEQRQNSCAYKDEGIITPHFITKLESGKRPLYWSYCYFLADVLKKKFNAETSGLEMLAILLTKNIY